MVVSGLGAEAVPAHLCDQQDRVLGLRPSPMDIIQGAKLGQRSSLAELGRHWERHVRRVCSVSTGNSQGHPAFPSHTDGTFGLPSQGRKCARNLGLYSTGHLSRFCFCLFYGAGIDLGFMHTR